MKRCLYAALGATASAGLPLLACSGESTIQNTYCAAGTIPQGGICTIPDSSVSDGSSNTLESSSDIAESEGSIDATKNDAPSNDDTSPSTDSSDDAPDTSDGATSDPCPSSTIFADCSGQCASNATGLCQASSGLVCTSGTTSNLVMVPAAATLRTPGASSSACEIQCMGASNPPVSVALVFEVEDPKNTQLFVSVGPPWQITDVAQANGVSAFFSCDGPASPNATKHLCMPITTSTPVAVWTTDPNPSARNIIIGPDPSLCQ